MLPRKINIFNLFSRLPDGVGTRTDVAELVKDSQFLGEGLSDFYVTYKNFPNK